MSKVETPWLAGWKEIAEYLRVSIRTAQSWEERDGMPVIRRNGGCIHAERPALDEWMRQQRSNQKAQRDAKSRNVTQG